MMTYSFSILVLFIFLPLIIIGNIIFWFKRRKSGQPSILAKTSLSVLRRVILWIKSLHFSITKFKDWFFLSDITDPFVEQISSNLGPVEPVTASPILNDYSEITHPITQQVSEQNVRINFTAEVPIGSVIHITITTKAEGSLSKSTDLISSYKSRPSFWFRSLSKSHFQLPTINSWFKPNRLNTALFILALVIYLLTRFTKLPDFPIYFFGDEAIQTNSAVNLVKDGLYGTPDEIFPAYFQNGSYYNLSASVYAQVIPYLLLGKSIWITRGTSILISLLAALAISWILRDAFNISRWWLGTLILAISPAWFLHSRTAFETVIFVSFYALFNYFYLLYRLKNPKYIYFAVITAGLAFYSYSPGQLVIAVSSTLLFLSDIKYHWKNRSELIRAAGLLLLMAVPYIRFRLLINYSPLDHLQQLDSYWIHTLPLSKKILIYASNYFYGLSPQYWFIPNNADLIRHQMKNYGHLQLWTMPFFLIGTLNIFRRLGNSRERTILITMLAAPSGAALADIGVTRALAFVIPASLLIALGINSSLDWVKEKVSIWYPHFAKSFAQLMITLLLFVTLSGLSMTLMFDALINGPTWFTDYGLYGMQFGARQIFEQTVLPKLIEDPNAYFLISPSWANGSENFLPFFIPEEYLNRVKLGQIYDIISNKPEIGPDYFFLVTNEEYEKIMNDVKFSNIVIRSEIMLPTGSPGFYMINLSLSKNIENLLSKEKIERRQPIETELELIGQSVKIIHSPLDGGQLANLMDDNPDTLVKTLEANPFILDFNFANPIPTSEVSIQTGSMGNFTINIKLFDPITNTPVEYTQSYKNLPSDPVVNIIFSLGPIRAKHVYIEIMENNVGDVAQIHVRGIKFK